MLRPVLVLLALSLNTTVSRKSLRDRESLLWKRLTVSSSCGGVDRQVSDCYKLIDSFNSSQIEMWAA